MNPTENIDDLPPAQRLLEAGKRYVAAEQAFEQAKRELNAACDEYNSDDAPSLPRFVFDSGCLYELICDRTATPKFRQVPSYSVIFPPTPAG